MDKKNKLIATLVVFCLVVVMVPAAIWAMMNGTNQAVNNVIRLKISDISGNFFYQIKSNQKTTDGELAGFPIGFDDPNLQPWTPFFKAFYVDENNTDAIADEGANIEKEYVVYYDYQNNNKPKHITDKDKPIIDLNLTMDEGLNFVSSDDGNVQLNHITLEFAFLNTSLEKDIAFSMSNLEIYSGNNRENSLLKTDDGQIDTKIQYITKTVNKFKNYNPQEMAFNNIETDDYPSYPTIALGDTVYDNTMGDYKLETEKGGVIIPKLEKQPSGNYSASYIYVKITLENTDLLKSFSDSKLDFSFNINSITEEVNP